MECGFCKRPSGLSPNIIKLIQSKEQEISKIFRNSKVDLYVLSHGELVYYSELEMSLLVNDVTHNDVRDMINRLKHSSSILGMIMKGTISDDQATHIQKGTFTLKSLHIKGSKTVFSLYTSAEHFVCCFDSQC